MNQPNYQPISKLIVENFFSWKERLELEFKQSGKVVIVGANGTGKSNLVRAIEMLAKSFPSPVEPDGNHAWDDTKPAELTLVLCVPNTLRQQLLEATALEILRMMQPNLGERYLPPEEETARKTRMVELLDDIQKSLDDGGMYRELTMGYRTRPEWRGGLRAHCLTQWNGKQIMLLSHGARTRYVFAAEDWHVASLVHLQFAPGHLVEDIAKIVLRKGEEPLDENKMNNKNNARIWSLDKLSENPGLVNHVRRFQSWLSSVKRNNDYDTYDSYKLRKEDTIYAAELNEQARTISKQSQALNTMYKLLQDLAGQPVPPDIIQQVKQLNAAFSSKVMMIGNYQPWDRESDEELPLGAIVRQFLCNSITMLREDRGLLQDDESSITVLTLDSLEERLFRAKNSSCLQERQQFAKVQHVIHELLQLNMDVVQEDYVVVVERERETHTEQKLVYSKEGSNVQFGLNQAFGGSYEVTLVAATLFLTGAQLVILDEPGRNLHAPIRKELRDVIYKQQDKTVLIVTHDVEMLSSKWLQDVFYCRMGPASSELSPLASLANNQKIRTFMASPDFRETFFSSGVIFVEGMADKRFMEALNAWFELCPNKPPIQGMEWLFRVKRLRYAVIGLGGERQSVRAVKIAHSLNIPWVFLCDWDAVLPKNGNNNTLQDRWDGRNGKSVVRIVRDVLQQPNTLFAQNDVPIEANIRQLCHNNGVFPWNEDLENMVQQTKHDWSKQHWSQHSFDELVDIIGELMNNGNGELIEYLNFLHNRGALVISSL